MKTFESNKCPGAIFITDGTGDFYASRTYLVLRIVNASLIPKVWNKTVVVFITKPDRSCKVAERFRPIRLTLILLKIMERIIDRHIRYGSLDVNQHAEPSEPTDSVLQHQLVTKIERTVDAKEIALYTILDIEQHDCLIYKPSNKSSRYRRNTCLLDYSTMLNNRTIPTAMAGKTLTAVTSRECPQGGGVLCPLLWCLEADGYPFIQRHIRII